MGPLVDSSVWIALFLTFDTQHQKAIHTIGKIKGKIIVPYCVISEVTTVLAYKHSKIQADRFLAYLRDNQDILLINDTLEGELRFYESLSARISFTDAALLFLSEKRKVPLITFDEQLAKLAKK
jgi:predicted nucleic acid-binding protein